MNSILDTIKDSVNVPLDEDCFDHQICTAINAVFFKLNQIGLDIDTSLEITDNSVTWQTAFPKYIELIPAIKTFVRDTVRLEFDPPTSSFAVQAIDSRIKEALWRLNTYVDNQKGV